MNVTIEPLAPQHFAGVRRVLDAVAREKRFLAFTEAPPPAACDDFLASIVAGNGCQWLALQDGAVLGWCDVLPSLGQARAHVGTLGIGLAPPARHRGIGARLMRAAIDTAWARGVTRIELNVRTDNANAKALYERLGFLAEGLRRHAYRIDGEYVDGWAMALLRDA